jgi:mRNA interferase MazF
VATFSRTSIVLVDFPFTDLSDTRLRPALVLAQATAEDYILCQITSNSQIDSKAIEINNADFTQGSLRQTSFARPNKIFTGHESLITRRVGILSEEATDAIVDAVVKILRNSK